MAVFYRRCAPCVTLPSMMRQSVTGAVLAGGNSARMGRDKASIVVDGVSLLERAKRVLAEVCDEVIVVGGVFADVKDLGDGPVIAIRALRDAKPHTRLLIIAVDQPRLNASILTHLLNAADEGVRCYQGEPLPLVVEATAQLAADARRLRDLITHELPLPAEHHGSLDDLDTPEALALFETSRPQ